MKPPASNIDEFAATVLVYGGEACLPKNLPNEWLHRLASDLHQALECEENEDDNGRCYLTAPSAAVAVILLAKNKGQDEVQVSAETMLNHLVDYQLELALENVTRVTEISHSQASLEEILNLDRKVTLRRVQAGVQ